MRQGWAAKSLGEIAVVGAGNSAPQDKALFVGGKYPFFRTSDVGRIHIGTLTESEDRLNEKGVSRLTLHPAGTILIPKSGASTFLDHRVITGVDGYVSSHLATVLAKPEVVDTKYLFYYLLTVEARSLGIDTAYPTLSLSQVNAIGVSLPPLPEQHRIVAILDEVFAGLAIATANAEKNLRNARELFESYLNSIFDENLQGRPTRLLGEISDFEGGTQPPKSQFIYEPRRGYVRLLQIRDFKTDKHAVFIPVSKKTRTCTESDVMIARYGASVGQIHRGKAGAYNVALIKTVPDGELINRDYFYFFLRSRRFQGPLSEVATRSAQAGFSKDDINPFDVPLPSIREQQEIVQGINAIAGESSELEHRYSDRMMALTALKQSILQKAFSGELTSPPSRAIKEAAE